jgi:hypothetical protein
MAMMTQFLEKHSQNAIIASLFAGAFSVLVSGFSIYLTVHYNSVSQERQARFEQITKFDQSTQAVIDAGGAFIAAINSDDLKALAAARSKLTTALATQMRETDDITKFFDKKAQRRASQYQSALEELNRVAQKTGGVTEMRPWVESFGHVLDTKSMLSHELYSQLGVTIESRRQS